MINYSGFPYDFDSTGCKTCGGNCCRGRTGYVWITTAELELMAGTLKMDVALFARQYVRQVHGRLSLQERVINGEYFCCFFDWIERRCTLYESRPDHCRTFPFWEEFRQDIKRLLRECPGVYLREDEI